MECHVVACPAGLLSDSKHVKIRFVRLVKLITPKPLRLPPHCLSVHRSPDSHKIGGQTFGSSAALRQLLEAIHVNAVAKARAGMGDCPVFSTNGE